LADLMPVKRRGAASPQGRIAQIKFVLVQIGLAP
jgi:hypothetical protein